MTLHYRSVYGPGSCGSLGDGSLERRSNTIVTQYHDSEISWGALVASHNKMHPLVEQNHTTAAVPAWDPHRRHLLK